MTDENCSPTSSDSPIGSRAMDFVTITGDPDELDSTGSSSRATATTGATGAVGSSRRLRSTRRTLALRTGAMRWRKHWSNSNRANRREPTNTSDSSSNNSPTTGTASRSNNQILLSTDSSVNHNSAGGSGSAGPSRSKDVVTHDSNASADSNPEDSSPFAAQTDGVDDGHPETQDSSVSDDGHVFANLDSSQAQSSKGETGERPPRKSELANVIEKAILDFCSSRTVETMRRMFAGVTSEMEALQGEGGRQGGDKSAQAPHPVTGEMVKEGIVIGCMDVFAPRVFREYRLEMKDCLVEGFLSDVGLFRSICYRTKCQLEVTRRLLNRKLCPGGRWVKYLIVRIVGPTLRTITCCDQLLQKAVPAFKHRIEYPKPAYCRLFFREDIPDNSMLYHCFQRTGGTSNRYGTLRLETPYRATTERTVGNCPWKSGSLKIGKLSFAGSGAHMSMKQVYPGYGYTTSSAVEPASKGVDAVQRIEQMHHQFITNRQQLVHDRRQMTIPVCR